MPNHYHLIVRQEIEGSISRFLQTTFNSFVQNYNLLESHSGTLFQGPAKSTLVDTDEYPLHAIPYVHTNPVSAKLVKLASDWEFSDCSVWVRDSGEVFPGKSVRDEWFEDGKEYEEFLEAYEPGTFSRELGHIFDL
jgi:putative transposase